MFRIVHRGEELPIDIGSANGMGLQVMRIKESAQIFQCVLLQIAADPVGSKFQIVKTGRFGQKEIGFQIRAEDNTALVESNFHIETTFREKCVFCCLVRCG